ncbi:MAG: hypothetical protein WCE48_03015, partial [Steroidobacteraceae bacterium]
LAQLFDLPVIDRMKKICGEVEMNPVLASYDRFLDQLEDKSISRLLKNASICLVLIFGRAWASVVWFLCEYFVLLRSVLDDAQAAAAMSFGIRMRL